MALKLITWDIQWDRGADGRVDLARVVGHAKRMADFDVPCPQEVSRNYPGLAASADAAQIEALRAIQQEACGHERNAADPNKNGTPFEGRARTGRGVLCGDFNCGDDDPLIARLQAPLADGGLPYVDGWPLAHPGRPHAKTVGLFDVEQWKGQQHCFDFFFVSSDLAPGVQSFAVDDQTQASDHQPLLWSLDF